MRITALSRGGLGVYGGHYDPHRDEAIVATRDGETEAVAIEYPSAPTSVTTTVSGVMATTPTISGNVVSLTLSGLNDGGHVDVIATVGGAVRLVRIRARSQTAVDRYCFDNELIGP